MNAFICSLKILISESGLKNKAIAEYMGLSERQFSDLMNGMRVIKASDISFLCGALKTDPNTLFGWGKTA